MSTRQRIIFILMFLVCMNSASTVSAQTRTQVNTNGFGDVNNVDSWEMAVYNNRLYTGTWNSTTGTEVWRYDGSTWTQVNTDGFGDATNSGVDSMAVYNNRLYAGVSNSTTGVEVWELFQPIQAPTMNEWGMIIFMVLAGLGSLYYLRRKRIQG